MRSLAFALVASLIELVLLILGAWKLLEIVGGGLF
jgi:hypothetical protein